MRLKLDWIDAILMGFGYVIAVVLGMIINKLGWEDSFASEMLYSAPGIVTCFVSLPLLRRALFGQPRVPAIKDGVQWRIATIFSLLVLLAGIGIMALSSVRFQHALESPPNFLQQSKEFHAKLTDFSGLIPKVKRPQETMKQFNQRLAKERIMRKEKRRQEIIKYAQEKKAEWQTRKAKAWKNGFQFVGVGLLVLMLGAFGVRMRYDYASLK